MSAESSNKITNALVLALGAKTGVFVATLLNRMLGNSLPVPIWIVNLLAGAGVVYFSTTQKGLVANFTQGFGTGHVVVGGFGGLKQITGSAALPTINGLGNPGALPMLPVASNEDREFVTLTGMDEDVNKFKMATSLM